MHVFRLSQDSNCHAPVSSRFAACVADEGRWGLTLGPLNERGSFLLAHIFPDQANLLDQFGLQPQNKSVMPQENAINMSEDKEVSTHIGLIR